MNYETSNQRLRDIYERDIPSSHVKTRFVKWQIVSCSQLQYGKIPQK